jgi:hypothetical protein
MAGVTFPSLGGHDDLLCENFPRGRSISFFGKRRSTGLKLCPRVIEGSGQNVYFLGIEYPVGKPINKTVHSKLARWSAQGAAHAHSQSQDSAGPGKPRARGTSRRQGPCNRHMATIPQITRVSDRPWRYRFDRRMTRWVMCGRRLIDKSFFTLMQHWSSGHVSGRDLLVLPWHAAGVQGH